jgi:Fic family protein
MNGSFGLRSRAQFQSLDQYRGQWLVVKEQPAAQQRFLELINALWPRNNCALDEEEDPAPWNSEALDPDRARQLEYHCMAARQLASLVQNKPALSPADLLGLQGLMIAGDPSAGHYREASIEPLAEGHQPTESSILPEVVANAMEWFNADSFCELHEIEKTALFLVKLLDILPFGQGNGRTLRLTDNFYLLRAQYPPAIIPVSRAAEYRLAIKYALGFHTQPLVDLLADSVRESLRCCL